MNSLLSGHIEHSNNLNLMKTFHKILTLVMALCAITCAAKENGIVVRQQKVGSFSSIEAECADVYITIGEPKNNFTVTASPEILDKFSATLTDGVLRLSCVKKSSGKSNLLSGLFKDSKKPVVKITVPSLDGINAGLCSRIIVDSAMTAGNMELSCETSSMVKIPALTATGIININVGMSSAVDVESLSAKSVALHCTTSSKIQVGTINSENLDARAEAGGKINALSGKVIFADFEKGIDGLLNFDGVAVVSAGFNNYTLR